MMADDNEPKWLSINEAARATSFTPQYIRSLIRKGILPARRAPLHEGTVVEHLLISEDNLKVFLLETPRKTKRQDGRNKFVFYANPTEYAQVVEALVRANLVQVVDSLHTANKTKPPFRTTADEPV